MEKSKKRKPIKLRIKKDIPDLTEDNIDSVFNDNFEKIDLDNVDYNTYLNNKELLNKRYISEHENQFSNLYPSLDDSDFNIKIAEKKEFNETKYDGTIYDIEERTISGYDNEVVQDLRDYLRRRGIKIYTEDGFKSIVPKWIDE